MKREETMIKSVLKFSSTTVTLGILIFIIALILSGCGSAGTETEAESFTHGTKGNPNLVTVYKPFG